MNHQILRLSAAHETGTKFYNIYGVFSEELERAVIVTHWGSLGDAVEVSPDGIVTPALRGKTKVIAVASRAVQWEMDRIKKTKAVRGYKFERIATAEYRDRSFFTLALGEQFPDNVQTKINDILLTSKHLASGLRPDTVIYDEVELSKEEVEKIAVAEIKPVTANPEWGTW